MPSTTEFPLLAVMCAVAFACWLANRVRRPVYVMLDWDLTCDCMSTPGEEDVATSGARRKFKNKVQLSDAEEIAYMTRLRLFLSVLLRRQEKDELRLFIVTRNSAKNVKWMLEHVVHMNASDFVVLSDCKGEKSKAEMLQRYLCLADEDMEGVVVLADDSSSEHANAASYALKKWSGVSMRHVRVRRPAKGQLYFDRNVGHQYGMMNQGNVVNDFWWAVHSCNIS